jgi:hypothetical protein
VGRLSAESPGAMLLSGWKPLTFRDTGESTTAYHVISCSRRRTIDDPCHRKTHRYGRSP